MSLNNALLWYDQSTYLPFKHRIERAVCYYEQTRGQRPTTILVHENEEVEATELFGVEIRPSANVLEYHFTIGQETKAAFSLLAQN